METHDPLDLTGQERQREQREVAAKLEGKTEGDDFMWLMSSKRGRRVVWRLLSEAGVFRVSFEPGMDAMSTAFREGHRNAGLLLINQIFELCPERYAEMAKEQQT